MKSIIGIEKLNILLTDSIKVYIESLNKYSFEGNEEYRKYFNYSIFFFDESVMKHSQLIISKTKRLLNAYYWYGFYIAKLKEQGIETSSHEQVHYKILEEIEMTRPRNFTWDIIQEIENELSKNLK